MKYILLIILGFVWFLSPVYAQEITIDTVANRKNVQAAVALDKSFYKMNHEQFFINYAFDDTSRALINLYFRKRITSKYVFMGICLATIPVSLAGSKEEKVCIAPPVGGYCRAETQRTYEPWVTPVVLPVLGGSLIYYIARHTRYSNKKLLQTLIAYEKGQPIPAVIREKLTAKYF